MLLFAAVVLLTMVALAAHWIRPNTPKPRFLALGILAIFLISWPPLSWLAAQTLEARYPRKAFPAGDAEVIVVLSGTVYGPTRQRPRALIGESTYMRCQEAAWLYENWRPLPVLACGGLGPPHKDAGLSPPKIPPAIAMRDFLQHEGIPLSMIWVEERSESTYESAVNAKRILEEKGIHRIALVTEAHHMLRAEKCFRAQGLDVIAAPSNFTPLNLSLGGFLPDPGTIAKNGLLVHEWVGLAWYKLRGRI